jgi:hypothetical protein
VLTAYSNTVHHWSASILPLLLAVEGMSLVEHTKREYAEYATPSEMAQYFEDGLAGIVWLIPLDQVPSTAVVLAVQLYMDGPTLVTELGFYKDSPTQLVLAASMAVILFCLHGLRVLWPKGFIKGESPQHNVDCRRNGWRMLIARH